MRTSDCSCCATHTRTRSVCVRLAYSPIDHTPSDFRSRIASSLCVSNVHSAVAAAHRSAWCFHNPQIPWLLPAAALSGRRFRLRACVPGSLCCALRAPPSPQDLGSPELAALRVLVLRCACLPGGLCNEPRACCVGDVCDRYVEILTVQDKGQPGENAERTSSVR